MLEEKNNIDSPSLLSVPEEDPSFTNRLVDRIKQKKISPYPRWRFLLKDYTVWSAGALALICGSLAVTVMIYLLRYNNWEIRENTHKSLGEFILLTLPYFWLIFLGLFIFILYLNIKHTKKGYRYPVWLIALAAISTSVFIGSLLSFTNLGERIDNIFGAKAPFYDQIINRQLRFWSQPEEGRLTGLVQVVSSTGSFLIIDRQGRSWEIISPEKDLSLELLSPGIPLNLIGEVNDRGQFEVDVVRPVGPGKGFLKRPLLPREGRGCSRSNCHLEEGVTPKKF